MLEARGLVVGHPGAEPGMPPAAGPVDLTLAPGEWVGLVGGNGSGKTALFLTLAGLAPPLKGAVTIDGLDPWAKGEGLRARERVGVVFQEPETQFVTDRVARELAFPLENLGWARSAIESRVRELLVTFDLVALAEAPPERLSGGEMQRVALAAAAAPRPRYLLLDEPASYLDRAGRDALVAWTRQRCLEDGCAVLWSECDPALTTEAGRVVTLPGPKAERATRDPVLPRLPPWRRAKPAIHYGTGKASR
jgi:energy-coupling factor transporter ATP-binding protein EcfA2